MNKENIQKAIQVMKRVREQRYAFDMRHWQMPHDDIFLASEKDAVECGTACCFAGWLAISPEFVGQLTVDDYGRPYTRDKNGMLMPAESAIVEVLGIPYSQAYGLCGMADSISSRGYTCSHFYNKAVMDITPEDVIAKLEELLEKGEENEPI